MTERHPNRRPLRTLPVELRRTTVPAAVQAWVARVTGADVVRTRRLQGASSSAMHRVGLADGRALVLRRYVWPGFLEDEPVTPRREAEMLAFATAHGVPAPQLIAADVDGSAVGDGVPVVLMSLLPGRAVAVPDLDALAGVAAAIHAVDPAPAEVAHDYFPWYATTTIVPPPRATDRSLWERAIGIWHDEMPAYRATFIHRDFHPGNVLWSRGRPSVVDWPNACRGPWGCDIAHCRANLIGLSGDDAADAFLTAYERRTGETFHWYWEIASVMEHGPSYWSDPNVEVAERRLRRALAML